MMSAATRTGREGVFSWRLSASPEPLVVGAPLVVELWIEGLTDATLGEIRPGDGLSLEGSVLKPSIDAASGRKGSSLRLDFAVDAEGPWTIRAIELSGREGMFRLADQVFEAGSPGSAQRAPPVWRWLAPESVYRYSTTTVSIVSQGGKSPQAQVAAIFPTPAGATMEPAKGLPLTWSLSVLDQGEILLPRAILDAGSESGTAQPRRILVLPLPAALEASRAQGRLSLAAGGPGIDHPRRGDLLVFRETVSGLGNLPLLRLPSIRASLDGRLLGEDSFTVRRKDEVSAVAGGYEGRITVETSFAAPGTGRLRVSFPPFAVLEPDGALRELRVQPIEVLIGRGLADKEGGRDSDPLVAKGRELAPILAKSFPSLSRLDTLLTAGRIAPAMDLLRTEMARNLALGSSRQALLLEVVLKWEGGSRAEALAKLYGLARRQPGDTELQELAMSASRIVGGGPPILDSLPPPQLFSWIAAALFLVILLLFLLPILVFRLRRQRLSLASLASPARKAISGLALLAALTLLGLALASGRERRIEYAVVWAEEAKAVPSPLAEKTDPLVKGQSGRVQGRAPGYYFLRFQDGSLGWVERASVYLY
jgi:hypothetical protein